MYIEVTCGHCPEHNNLTGTCGLNHKKKSKDAQQCKQGIYLRIRSGVEKLNTAFMKNDKEYTHAIFKGLHILVKLEEAYKTAPQIEEEDPNLDLNLGGELGTDL